jgi:hypothetical protein
MMTKFPRIGIAATFSKKEGNGLTDPRRKKSQGRTSRQMSRL